MRIGIFVCIGETVSCVLVGKNSVCVCVCVCAGV